MSFKLNGTETISGTQKSVLDFWSWAYSDILSNRNRSIFAEFLVSAALNQTDKPRVEWDAIDIRYQNKKIEVKSASYIQSWQQNKLSTIKFDIGKKLGWNSEDNTLVVEAERAADCYVFCLFTEEDKTKADILNSEKWLFLIATTRQLEERFNNQKTVSLNSLKPICLETDFGQLKETIEKVLC